MMMSRRWFHSGRVLLSDNAVVKSAPTATKSGVGIGKRISWFFGGAAISLGAGYYQLTSDLEVYTKNVEHSLAELRRDTLESQEFLRKKIALLEKK